jgi:hypothetical protein
MPILLDLAHSAMKPGCAVDADLGGGVIKQ